MQPVRNSRLSTSVFRADRHITAAKIAKDLDMSARQIERMLADLKAKGIIRREGANRNGYWIIVD